MEISGLSSFNLQEMKQRIFNKFDGDSDGKLSIEEFKAFPTPNGSGILGDTQGIEDTFAQLDKDGDNQLTQEELAASASSLTSTGNLSSTSLAGLLSILGNGQENNNSIAAILGNAQSGNATFASMLGNNQNTADLNAFNGTNQESQWRTLLNSYNIYDDV
jgi:Ca2+-binding EF-hand superfamily protein